ncbi:MAG: response regulator [bacterium]
MSGKVLVVDDDERITDTLSLVLEKRLGCEMLVVNNATDAVDAACSFKPDLIILDMFMPDLDGGTLSRDLKLNSMTSHVPVLLFTSVASSDDVAIYNRDGHQPAMVSKAAPLGEFLTAVRLSLGVCA